MYDNDFMGFKFNGVHFTIFPHPSEDSNNVVKLTRVSEGDRYTNNLLPLSQDATVDVPGGDGTYYFGTDFKQRQFDLSFAFDDLSEEKIRKIRQVFSKRNSLAPLIFDEEPYKYWMVKCQGMPQLRTVCFVENAELGNVNLIHTTDLAPATSSNGLPDYQTIGTRVYKGEGSVSFIAYYPFARCGSNGTSKWLNGYSTTWDSNKIYATTLSQWSGAAGLKTTQGNYDNYLNHDTVSVVNPGDIEADFKVIMDIPAGSNSPYDLLSIQQGGNDDTIEISDVVALREAMTSHSDTYLLYDSHTELLEGCQYINSKFVQTGNLYNRFISPSSNLFKIKIGEATLTTGSRFQLLEYDYLYY